MGAAHSVAMGCNLVATVVAAPLYAIGGYHLVGAVSIAVALLQGVLALALPAAPRATTVDEVAAEEGAGGRTGFAARYLGMLRTGVGEVHRRPVVRHGVLLCALLLGTTAYDEFFPLLAREQGATATAVPLLIGITVLGQMIGTALAGRTARLGSRAIAAIVAAAAVGLVAGSLLTRLSASSCWVWATGSLTTPRSSARRGCRTPSRAGRAPRSPRSTGCSARWWRSSRSRCSRWARPGGRSPPRWRH